MSVSNYGEGQMLGLLPSPIFVQLHTGDPGEDGTANVATESTRKSVTLGAASGGVRASTADAEWTNVAGTETYSHISLWSAASAGNCWGSGPLAANRAVTAGDTFRLPSGQVTYTID
jgi:hypothetical protein